MSKRTRGIFTLLVFLLWACPALSQKQVTYEANNKLLSEVIAELSGRYNIHFSYSIDNLDSARVTIKAEGEELSVFLQRLFDSQHIAVKQSKGNFYYLEKRKRRLVLLLNDKENGEKLPFATVSVKGSRIRGYSDMNGKAVFMADHDDDRVLAIHSMGYKTMEIPLKDLAGDTLEIPMEFDYVELPAVHIEYQNDAMQLKALSEVRIDPKKMKVLPGLPEPDILLSTQLIPGIESDDETASGINVRGGNKDELLTYWDRIPVYQQAHFFGTLTAFIPNTVDRVTAYKNYIPSSFSGSTSGLIDIKLSDSIPRKFEALSNSNMTHSDLLVSVPVTRKMGVIAAGRWAYTHLFNSPTFKAFNEKLYNGSRDRDVLGAQDDDEGEFGGAIHTFSEIRYSDLNLKLLYRPTQRSYLSISSMMNGDSFDFTQGEDGSDVESFRFHNVGFQGFNAFFEQQWKNSCTSQVSFSRANYTLENESLTLYDEDESVDLYVNNGLVNNELKVILNKSAEKSLDWEVGYQFNKYGNEVVYNEQHTYEGAYTDSTVAEMRAHGLFMSINKWSGDHWKINPQLRGDYYQELNQFIVNPVINAQYHVNRAFWTKFSYGHYAQALRLFNESQINTSNISESVWLLSNTEEDLDILRSRQLSIGALYEKSGLLLDIDFYYKRTIGTSLLDQFQTVDEDISYLIGETRSKGMDFLLKKKFGRYQQWISYSLSKTENHFDDLSPKPFQSSLDRPHQLRWVHNYYYNQFEFSLGLIAKSGAPYTKPVDLEIWDEEELEYEIIYGDWNTLRLPTYHRLDFSAWYKFPKNEDQKIIGMLGLSVLNLYNRKNVWRRYYIVEDYDDNDEPEITEEERYFLGLTPNITLKLHFR